ncbi:LOW QUALITY PROTEIN: hypothetical protein ACHAW6_015910 [Cyclotella cf. meneghiniana]
MGHYMPRVTLMGIIERIPILQSLATIKTRLLMIRRLSHTLPKDRSCIVNGRMAVILGRSYLKESHALQVAEFALAMGIADEPTFNWWTGLSPWLNAEVLDTTSEPTLGLSSPKLWINKAAGTSFWHDAIEVEMKIVWVSFDVLADGTMPPPHHEYMRCYMMFNVKMEYFCHKARLVAGGHIKTSNSHICQHCVMRDHANSPTCCSAQCCQHMGR